MTVHKLTDVLLPGEADDDLVKMLEDLTDRARCGELTAVAWTATRADGGIANGWECAGGTMFGIAAGILALHGRYAAYMTEGDE